MSRERPCFSLTAHLAGFDSSLEESEIPVAGIRRVAEALIGLFSKLVQEGVWFEDCRPASAEDAVDGPREPLDAPISGIRIVPTA